MLGTARKFVGHVLPQVIRPLRVMWNEIIGFIFLVLAVVFTLASRRMIGDFDGSLTSILKMAASGGFVLLLVYYGVSSFLRARKISRS